MSEIDISSLNFLVYLTRGSILPLSKKYINYLREEYEGDEIAEQILDLIDESESFITEEEFTLKLKKLNISTRIKNKMIGEFSKPLPPTVDSMIKEYLLEVVSKRLIMSKTDLLKNPKEFIKEVSKIDLDFLELDGAYNDISEFDFGEIKIEEALESLGKPIKSSFEFINKSSPINGYISNQVVLISGKPGAGKSLFAMNETITFIKNGHKVLYTAIGDLTPYDFMCRLCAIYFNITMNDASIYIEHFYEKLKKELPLGNLKILFINPERIDITDYINYLRIKKYINEYQIFIIDYDSNLKSELGLYEKGSEIYSELNTLSRMNDNLVLVLSQPKVMYWEQELIPLEAISESSRKQHYVDMAITIGINPDSVANIVGYFNICKNRRGGILKYIPFMLDYSGRFIEIDENTKTYLQNSELRQTYAKRVETFGIKRANSSKNNISKSDVSEREEESSPIEGSEKI